MFIISIIGIQNVELSDYHGLLPGGRCGLSLLLDWCLPLQEGNRRKRGQSFFVAISIHVHMHFHVNMLKYVIVLVYNFRTAGDEVLVFERCNCNNFGYLIGALYVYKGLFVVFGLFLAYESRNVKYIYINDSRFVSITMYIVVILVGIGAPLSLVLAVHLFHDTAYALAVFNDHCCLYVLSTHPLHP